ncbi:MAG: hypothetical protein RR653_05690 [Clostridia bacterium]
MNAKERFQHVLGSLIFWGGIALTCLMLIPACLLLGCVCALCGGTDSHTLRRLHSNL